MNADKFAGHTPAPWRAARVLWDMDSRWCVENVSNLDGTFTRADAELMAAAPDLLAENEALRACLTKANSQTEYFEREWYLRGDELEALRNRVAELEALATDVYLQGQLGGAHP